MTTFALVHGSAHGAWCWERLVPLLKARGHRAIAMDLPCEDNSAGFSTYADVVMRAIPPTDDGVVLVGHSLGGLTIPLVAALRPVKRLVFLCAVVPILGGLPFGHDPEAPPMSAPGLKFIDHEDRTFSFTPASAASHLYNRCTPTDTAWAIARLRRQSGTPNHEVCPLSVWPDVDRVYVACTDDRIVMPEYAQYVARSRAGVDAIELDADHSPFLSTPAALADLLVALA